MFCLWFCFFVFFLFFVLLGVFLCGLVVLVGGFLLLFGVWLGGVGVVGVFGGVGVVLWGVGWGGVGVVWVVVLGLGVGLLVWVG
ncbi:hypothetical protein BV380_29595, partial [Klebsiella pneumoniae]